MSDFVKEIHNMFDHIWDCEIDHPVYQDTVGELMEAVIQTYEKHKPTLGTNLAEVGMERKVKGFPIDADDLLLRVEEKYGFKSRDRLYDIIRKMPKYELPSAEEESFEWCTDCKEYDQEKHCCHRFSKMIRKTIEEMQIVHCIDCQHSEYDSVYGDRYCHYNGKAEVVNDYHFCSYAERREDG